MLCHDGMVCHSCQRHEQERKTWPSGPWDDEPNVFGPFEHAGLNCILHRGGQGCWCGYVGVPPGHPAHGKHYGDVDVEAHGGLTYADKCQGHICHTPKPGESDNVWWFGFDCGHAYDLAPSTHAMRQPGGILHNVSMKWADLDSQDVYRDMEYCRAETVSLAEQLAAMVE